MTYCVGVLMDEGLIENSAAMGKLLEAGMRELAARHGLLVIEDETGFPVVAPNQVVSS